MKTITFILTLALAFSIGILSKKMPQINVTSCPIVESTINREYIKFDGYDCTKIGGSDTDILQPSGYWIGTSFECWKLKTPIEEFCAQHPEYHCDLSTKPKTNA